LARITRKTEGGGKIDWEALRARPCIRRLPTAARITSAQGVNGTTPTSPC